MIVAVLVLSVCPQLVKPPVDAQALSRDTGLPHELKFLAELDPYASSCTVKSGPIGTGMSVSGECQIIDARKFHDTLTFNIPGDGQSLLRRVTLSLSNQSDWRRVAYERRPGHATFLHRTKSFVVYFVEQRPGTVGQTSVTVTSIRGS